MLIGIRIKRLIRAFEFVSMLIFTVQIFYCCTIFHYSYRLEDRGELISVKFSYDKKILAVQRSPRAVVCYSNLFYCLDHRIMKHVDTIIMIMAIMNICLFEFHFNFADHMLKTLWIQ